MLSAWAGHMGHHTLTLRGVPGCYVGRRAHFGKHVLGHKDAALPTPLSAWCIGIGVFIAQGILCGRRLVDDSHVGPRGIPLAQHPQGTSGMALSLALLPFATTA